jgi:hypothetical protein
MTPDEARAKASAIIEESRGTGAEGFAELMEGRLKDLIAAALIEAAGQWTSIAAHDGTSKEVLGMDAKGHVEKTWYFAPSSSTKNWLRFRGNKPWTPTHWRHLPAPPETDAKA